jgi:hypothetical protein
MYKYIHTMMIYDNENPFHYVQIHNKKGFHPNIDKTSI